MDKFKSCKDLETGEDCPDRTIHPNCHSTCEGFLHRCEVNRKIQEERKKRNDTKRFYYEERNARDKYVRRNTK